MVQDGQEIIRKCQNMPGKGQEIVQGVPKKIVHSNFLSPGHDFLTGSSNYGSQHHFQNLQAKGVYKSKSLFLKLIWVKFLRAYKAWK